MFLNLDFKNKYSIFVYKLFDKSIKFPFFLVCMPHFESNIPSTILYSSIISEFLCIAICSLKLEHFLPGASEFYSRMLSQGANQSCINKQIQKSLQRYPGILKKYAKNYKELLQELKKYLSSKWSRSNQCFLLIKFVMKYVLITNNHCQIFFVS